jgi:hypothetical protein
MFSLRCTRKLLGKLKVKPDPSPPAPTTRLGDWYANALNVGDHRLVLCTSERTLLPVLVPIAGPDLPGNLKAALAEFLKGPIPRRAVPSGSRRTGGGRNERAPSAASRCARRGRPFRKRME